MQSFPRGAFACQIQRLTGGAGERFNPWRRRVPRRVASPRARSVARNRWHFYLTKGTGSEVPRIVRRLFECVRLFIEIAAFVYLVRYVHWTKIQARANEQAARAAKTASDTAQRQLELSERPWILASHEIEKPLTFFENGSAVLVLKEKLQNSGQSAAVSLASWADIIPLDSDPGQGWKAALAPDPKCGALCRMSVRTPGLANFATAIAAR
jgi:hypothetical protein